MDCLPKIRLFQFYIIIVIFFSCNSKKDVFLNTSPQVDYIGMNKCASCHTTQYESFLNTGMGKSISPALKVNSSSDFSKSLYDTNLFFHYNPHWIQDSLFLDEYQLLNNDTVHYLKYKTIRFFCFKWGIFGVFSGAEIFFGASAQYLMFRNVFIKLSL